MKIVIDFHISYNDDPALRIFTNELWEDIADAYPKNEYIVLLKRDQTKPASKNLLPRRLTRTPIAAVNRYILQRALRRWSADEYVRVHNHQIDIYQMSAAKRISPLPGVRIDFTLPRKQDLLSHQNHEGAALTVKPVFRHAISSATWAETESTRTSFTGGRSFFLYAGNITEQQQLLELLKAFSVFKKWQQSNMQLVIAGYRTAWTPVFEQKLSTYKYRSDVVVLMDPTGDDLARTAAASYAMLAPGSADSFPFSMLLAIQSQKAVIAADYAVHRNIVSNAEWIDTKNTAEGFAKAMQLLYKDEKHLQVLAKASADASMKMTRSDLLAFIAQRLQ